MKKKKFIKTKGCETGNNGKWYFNRLSSRMKDHELDCIPKSTSFIIKLIKNLVPN